MTNANDFILSMNSISKSFPGVNALENVDFTLKRGEIHALIGENGAGKSTLIKVLTGVEHPDAGSIELDGKPVQVRSPQHSQEIGISTVYQEVNLCTNISVAENIMLGHEPHLFFGGIDWKKMNALAMQMLERLDVEIDVTQPLGNFSVAIQQMAAIARSLEITSAKILILDEPTSSLDVHEANRLFEVMQKLKGEGLGIIFITHFLDQVYQVSDRITVLRNGKLVGTYSTASLPRMELIAKMLGRSLSELDEVSKAKFIGEQKESKKSVLEAKGLGLAGSLKPFDMELHANEVVGIAGLLGSGRTEMANLLFGIDTPDTGTLTLNGKKVNHFSPLESLENGIALCPEDRKAEGVVGDLTIRENIILALQARYGWFKFLNLQKQYELAEKYIKLLGISTPSPDQLVQKFERRKPTKGHPGALVGHRPEGIDPG